MCFSLFMYMNSICIRNMRANRCATIIQLSHYLFIASIILNLLFILILLNQDFSWKPITFQYNAHFNHLANVNRMEKSETNNENNKLELNKENEDLDDAIQTMMIDMTPDFLTLKKERLFINQEMKALSIELVELEECLKHLNRSEILFDEILSQKKEQIVENHDQESENVIKEDISSMDNEESDDIEDKDMINGGALEVVVNKTEIHISDNKSRTSTEKVSNNTIDSKEKIKTVNDANIDDEITEVIEDVIKDEVKTITVNDTNIINEITEVIEVKEDVIKDEVKTIFMVPSQGSKIKGILKNSNTFTTSKK